MSEAVCVCVWLCVGCVCVCVGVCVCVYGCVWGGSESIERKKELELRRSIMRIWHTKHT